MPWHRLLISLPDQITQTVLAAPVRMRRCGMGLKPHLKDVLPKIDSQWTGARKGPAFFAYATNYLIDTDHSATVDVAATRSMRQAEVGSVRMMLGRVKDTFDLHPERIIADTAYGSAPMLGWLVDRKIAPHIPVIDKAGRTDGTWSGADFEWDAANDQ